MSNDAKRVGVFVGVLVLSVAVGALVLGVGGQSAPAAEDTNASAFNTEDAVAEVPEESGEISMSADGNDTVVVIDTTRSAGVTQESVTPMANALTESGATVRYSSGGSAYGASLNATLSDADAYISVSPQQPYTDADINGLQAFTDAGGRVVLMNEPQGQAAALSSLFGGSAAVGPPSPTLPLLNEYGLSYDNGYLYNMGNNSNNYRTIYATPTGDSELTDGVDQVVLHESIAVNGGQTTLTATEGTTQSTTRRTDTYGVLTQSGNLTVVGDSSIVSQEYVYRADNEVLVGNLLDYLVSGDKQPEDAPGGSAFGGGDGGFGGGDDGFGGGGGDDSTPTVPDNDTDPLP